MHLRCIACDALARPVYWCAARSPQVVDVSLERFGWHAFPHQLRQRLQSVIDRADQDGRYDAIVLAYGLCGTATAGLRAGLLPLVIPRAHDCITLFLGGRKRYQNEFNACPGTYWYVQDYIERTEREDIPLSIGAYTSKDADQNYAEYVEKYGVDNANYLLEVMHEWQSHYERAAYIDLGIAESETGAAFARQEAKQHGWRFERLKGNLDLIRRLLDGDWVGDDFLLVQPGQQVEMSGGEDVICTVNAEQIGG